MIQSLNLRLNSEFNIRDLYLFVDIYNQYNNLQINEQK